MRHGAELRQGNGSHTGHNLSRWAGHMSALEDAAAL
jgi:hypothetical protein